MYVVPRSAFVAKYIDCRLIYFRVIGCIHVCNYTCKLSCTRSVTVMTFCVTMQLKIMGR
jgi:hypothetical protein